MVPKLWASLFHFHLILHWSTITQTYVVQSPHVILLLNSDYIPLWFDKVQETISGFLFGFLHLLRLFFVA